jgi:hypothetical protein
MVWSSCTTRSFGPDAPDVLRMLGDEATHEELRILGAFQYVCMQVIFVCYRVVFVLMHGLLLFLSLKL